MVRTQLSLSGILWDLTSVVIFPIGIYRACKYYLCRWLIPKLIIPGINRFSREHLLKMRRRFIEKDPVHRRAVTLQTVDGAVLEGLELIHPSQKGLAPEEQKWVLYYNGNRGASENSFETKLICRISSHAEVNVFSCNYRGIGNPDQEHAWSSRELVIDGETMLQHLLFKRVPPEKILLHGWSLGGAVAVEVASNHQTPGHEVHLCCDRSFSTFFTEVRSFVPYVGWLAGFLAFCVGWRFNSVKKFESIKGHKFTIHHPQDSVIRSEASLHEGLKLARMNRVDRQLKRIRIFLRKYYGLGIREVLSSKWNPDRLNLKRWKRLVLKKMVKRYRNKIKQSGRSVQDHRKHYQPQSVIERRDVVHEHHIPEKEVLEHLEKEGIECRKERTLSKIRKILVGKVAHKKYLNRDDFKLYLDQIKIAFKEGDRVGK